ncbi:MAG TPA: porin [Xanthobacteraceae bacterium]
MKRKCLLSLAGASCVALLEIGPAGAQSAVSTQALEQKIEQLQQQQKAEQLQQKQKIEELERLVKALSDQAKANKRAQPDASAASADASFAKAGALPAKAPLALNAWPVTIPPNAALVDKKGRAAPNIIFEPLQPGMNLINDPNTWLGIYGTAEADIVSQSHANVKGATRYGFDAAPWMSANRFGVTGAHTFDLEHRMDVIVRLEAEYQLPTGNQDTPGVLFNRDAWIGVQSEEWGKLTVGRQNSLGRDATQFYGDPYGTASPNLTEGGYINQTNTQAFKEYVGSPTGSRVDSGIVWKKVTGNLYTALMYQFGSPQGQSATELNPGNFGPNGVGSEFENFNQGSSQAGAIAYNFGMWNLGGYYEHANIVGMNHQVATIGGNIIPDPHLRLNAGFLYYTADQTPPFGQRKDKVIEVSGMYAPEGKFDFALAYYWIKAENAMLDNNGFILNPWSDTSAVPNQDANGNNFVTSGVRQTVYGSVRYKFDPFTLVFVGFAYTKLSDGFPYSEAHGFNDILDLGTGFRYIF